MKSTFFILIAASFNTQTAKAGDSTGYKKFPRIVLVQLKSEQNRMHALEKSREYDKLKEVKNDAQRAMQATVNDFHDNFKFCPVYYYIDSNFEAVRNKDFKTVLLNEDFKAVSNPDVNKNSTDYLIVYYGYPALQEDHRSIGSETKGANAGRGLVVLDDQYHQIAYSAIPEYGEGSDKGNRRSQNAYVAKHFDIRYIPFAADFNKALEGRNKFRGHIIPKKHRKADQKIK